MSPVSKEALQKKRRDARVVKRLFKTPQEKKESARKSDNNYRKRMKEHRENNLHPDSIAMTNPQWKPELLHPPHDKPSSRVSEEMVSPISVADPFTSRHLYRNLHNKMKPRKHFYPTLSIQPT
jgi:hypothetical protein